MSRPKDESELDAYLDNGYDRNSARDSFQKEIQSYLDEYRLMKKLQGESNIVSVEECEIVPHENGIGGDIFIRMELLRSLQQVLRKRMLSENEIIKLGKDISHALMLCECENIIHRDIKPANIMISKHGDYKLGDFGVSKIMDHTTFATMMGTQNYEAPEVIHREQYGHQADIYSLGITLYWFLNNRKMPFVGADEKLTYELQEEAGKRRYWGEKLPAPKNGSDALKEVILKACAYNPTDRYPTAQDFYDALIAAEAENNTKSETDTLGITEGDDGSVNFFQSRTSGNTSETSQDNSNSRNDSFGSETSGNSWGASEGAIGNPGGYNHIHQNRLAK